MNGAVQQTATNSRRLSAENNKCKVCGRELPEKHATLDRLEAMKGHAPENTRLICRDCDEKVQSERGCK
jgi:DNA repair exonuclease SbcCD ATPase subunit